MLIRIVLFFVGLFLIPSGWHEVSIAMKYKEPVQMSCKDFLEAKQKPAWVSVPDCVVYLGHFQTIANKDTGAVSSIWVMLFPSEETAEDDKYKSTVAISISDSDRVKAINENLDKVNQLADYKNEAAKKEFLERYRKFFETGPLILKEEAFNEDLSLIKDKLDPEHATYDYSSLDDKSSIWVGVGMMVGGLLMSILVAVSFFLRKK